MMLMNHEVTTAKEVVEGSLQFIFYTFEEFDFGPLTSPCLHPFSSKITPHTLQDVLEFQEFYHQTTCILYISIT